MGLPCGHLEDISIGKQGNSSLMHLPNKASGLLSHFFPEFESIMTQDSWMT